MALFIGAVFLLNRHSKLISSLVLLDGTIPRINAETAKYYSSIINSYGSDFEWRPDLSGVSPADDLIVGEAALLVDADSGKVLYSKQPDRPMKIASLVKIMTAVVVLEHSDLKKEITITSTAASIGENSMGITAGEVYTVEELLYGLMLNSGNDAAYALAEGAAGDAEEFIRWMNIKAAELGLTNTHFSDPSGLDDTTVSTAVDLVKLSRYAMKFPAFREIVKTAGITLTSDEHKYLPLENQTNLLTTYPGVKGIKTGYTEEAGLCLVTYASNSSKELIGVVLNSIDRKGDMILMLDYGYAQYGITVEHNLLSQF